ncbi:MAG: cytochrome c oxidase subunit II [Vicinamibacterales bacterium]
MWSGLPLFPEQASTMAPRVDNLYFFLLAIALFFSTLIALLVIVFAIKYRRTHPAQVGAPITGSVPLELMWSIIPFGIAMVIFTWSANVYFDIHRPPDETLQIYAVGKRWMWKFQHIDGQREINELHVPVGRPVKITATSEDVIHDLYFPAFRVKTDVIPGRYLTVWFNATKAGEYRLFCAEYCGTKHSGMIGRVIVMEPAAYQAWLGGGAGEMSMAARGQRAFQDLACHTCHMDDAGGRGPTLRGLFGSQVELADGSTVVADEAYLRESILNPQARLVAGYQPQMPTFQGLVNEETLMGLIEHIKLLQPAAAAPAQEER